MALWLEQQRAGALVRVRSPLALGARRIALAAQRCGELAEALEQTRWQLNNLSPHTESGRVSTLEERALRLAAELHSERLGLWQDLAPLAQKLDDAQLEATRRAWLELLAEADGSVGSGAENGSGGGGPP